MSKMSEVSEGEKLDTSRSYFKGKQTKMYGSKARNEMVPKGKHHA